MCLGWLVAIEKLVWFMIEPNLAEGIDWGKLVYSDLFIVSFSITNTESLNKNEIIW